MKCDQVLIMSRQGRPKFEIHPPEAGKNPNTECFNDQNEDIRKLEKAVVFVI